MPLRALLLAVLLLPAVTDAQSCPGADTSAALASVGVEERIAFLRGRLEAERTPAHVWSWTFGVVNGALTAGQLAAAATTRSGSSRGLLLAGAASSGLGVAQIVLAPVAPASEDLAPREDHCLELTRMERALTRAARNERLGTGPAAQVGNLLINVGFGIAAGLIARRPLPGLVTFGVGWSLGEAQILTEPTRLEDALERYRAGALAGEEPSRGRRPSVEVAGLNVRITF